MVTTETNDNSYNKHLLQWLQEIRMSILAVTIKTDFSGTTMTAYNCYNNGCLDWCYLSHLLPLTEIIALIAVYIHA